MVLATVATAGVVLTALLLTSGAEPQVAGEPPALPPQRSAPPSEPQESERAAAPVSPPLPKKAASAPRPTAPALPREPAQPQKSAPIELGSRLIAEELEEERRREAERALSRKGSSRQDP